MSQAQPPLTDAQFGAPPATPPRLFDSHAHIGAEAFRDDLQQILQRARAFGVERILAIGAGTGQASNETALRLAATVPGVVASVGIHPHEADLWNDATAASIDTLLKAHAKKQCVAVGEIGLDFHYNFSSRKNQQAAFAAQLALAAHYELPFIIHTREAHAETYATLQQHEAQIRRFGGLIHCFSQGPREAEEYLALGLHLSFSGVVTFPKADELRQALALVPADRLLIETDAPYLTPHPHRGKRNEPACVYWTALKIAELQGRTVQEVAAQTYANASRLFLSAKVA